MSFLTSALAEMVSFAHVPYYSWGVITLGTNCPKMSRNLKIISIILLTEQAVVVTPVREKKTHLKWKTKRSRAGDLVQEVHVRLAMRVAFCELSSLCRFHVHSRRAQLGSSGLSLKLLPSFFSSSSSSSFPSSSLLPLRPCVGVHGSGGFVTVIFSVWDCKPHA
jgi:hypothetical protein